MVSPRKSRSKSLWASSSVTGMPRRANNSDSITPAGPPPTTTQEVWWTSAASSVASAGRGSGAMTGLQRTMTGPSPGQLYAVGPQLAERVDRPAPGDPAAPVGQQRRPPEDGEHEECRNPD